MRDPPDGAALAVASEERDVAGDPREADVTDRARVDRLLLSLSGVELPVDRPSPGSCAGTVGHEEIQTPSSPTGPRVRVAGVGEGETSRAVRALDRAGARSRLERWEPGESRGSRRVLRGAGGENPPAYSPRFTFIQFRASD